MAKKKQQKPIDELVRELSQEETARKPSKPGGSMVVDALEDVKNGVPLVVNRPVKGLNYLKLAGQKYSIGDEYLPDEKFWGNLDKLINAGYLVTQSAWNGSKRYSSAKKFLENDVRPKHARLNQVRRVHQEAAAQVVELENQLQDARQEVQDLGEREQQLEAELREILEGPEAEAILEG